MTDERIESFIKKVLLLMDLDYLRSLSDRLVRKNYNSGFEDVEKSIRTSFNFVPNEKAISSLREYAFDNIKGLRDDLALKLRQQLVESLTNREGAFVIAKRVRKVMGVGVARAQAIARTESHRAYNVGAFTAAEQSGLKLKKMVYNPAPETDICKFLTKQKPIPLNNKFSYKGDSWLLPPFHVNCRSRVLYLQEGGA